MTTAIGLATMAIGLAYLGLGALSASEVLVLRRERGISRFGVGFALMAASCGPHHLIHGWHILSGMDANALVTVSTLVGLPSGVVFVWLRIEAMRGGRGDRFISRSPWFITAVPLLFLLTAGALIDRGLAGARSGGVTTPELAHGLAHDVTHGAHGSATTAFDPTSVVFLTNAFVSVTYALVGVALLQTQVRRRPSSGGWSVSGLALAGIFPTCALMHLMYALSARGSAHTLFFDLLGVPASVYFLTVVRRIHRESIVDWNRRPAIGRVAAPGRPSPWEART